MFTFLYKQHQRLQKEREGLLGWPQSWLTLIPSEEPSNGTKGFWTAGCHGGISPNAGAVRLWSEHQCGPGSSRWERRKLRPTPSRGSANPLKNREWVKGITMNTLKKKPIHADLEKHRLPLWSVLFCHPPLSAPFFHLVLKTCWSLQVTARLLTKSDKTGGRDFYRTALSQLAWPRPGPRRTHHLANSPHQQKDNRETAFIRFNGWLWWIARSK